MADEAQAALSPAGASFAAHVRAFHATLPDEERILLERIFALAESAATPAGDAEAQGYAMSDNDPVLFPAPSLIRLIQFDFSLNLGDDLLRERPQLLFGEGSPRLPENS